MLLQSSLFALEVGALLLGKTTRTEFAGSYNGSVAGTGNPHNPEHTPGGSSSGSGAAVGDYQVPIALGTQTVGSVVRPASFNGTYGFKVPTHSPLTSSTNTSLTPDTYLLDSQPGAPYPAKV